MNQDILNSMVEMAGDMAAAAQTIALERYGRVATSRKPDGSEVTETDLAIQDMMIERIAAAYPNHAVIGEEKVKRPPGKGFAPTATYCWVIDPLDGTRNYARGVPVFSTSIAVLERGLPVVGLIRSLTTGDVYSAVRGRGTRHNGRPVRIASRPAVTGPVVAVQSTLGEGDAAIAGAVSGIALLRNLGSTALHLALVAIAAFDGAIARECKLWDIAAGALLVEETQGLCTDWWGRPLFPINPETYERADLPFVAARAQEHRRLLAQIHKTEGGAGC